MEHSKPAADSTPVAPKAADGPQGQAGPQSPVVRAAAGPTRIRRRHRLLALTFVLWVIAPLCAAGWYLFTVAHDQYASQVGFSVRTEEVSSAIELLGGITELSGSSSSDTDILYEYIQSQQMVRAVGARLDLRDIYTVPDDPVFALGEDARIEALADYWQRMVKVFYDRGSGLIEVRVLAFDPGNATAVATAIFDESSAMINKLSTIARADATRYAEEELERARERLKVARQATTAFRNRTGIIDPKADIQGQMGVVNALQSQLAEALVARQTLLDGATSAADPRVTQLDGRIEAIRKQIAAERSQFGGAAGAIAGTGAAVRDGPGDAAYSTLLEEYEALEVDREFAEKSFLSALASRDASVAEAQRQSRYLASYVAPTLAETAQYPRRFVLMAIIGGFLLISWSIGAMVYYSLRDRR
ncbi:sugar transporter [Puniceibacterium confluentis]|uniref:sugar transporter n=1 Tax=Puniceibacterium confluentis TaxID=1958944 RepID=UPI001FEAF9D2|nr:sugar transporter [Puniceibacterium confluentis]